MRLITPQASRVLQHPAAFALQVIRGFRANQGLLLAGGVAYYTLLSIVPLLILILIALSHVLDQAELLATLRRALESVVPGQSTAVMREATVFLAHRDVIGWVLFASMLFFSSLAFSGLQNAISVIFLHRVALRKWPLIASALLPFAYIVFIGAALFFGTYVLANLMAIGRGTLVVFGQVWSLSGFSRFLIYVVGVAGEVLVISSIYYFMPVGRLPALHALIGGASVGALWEIVRYAMVWYFDTLSQVSVVYGSLATVIIVLLSLDVAATLLLLGAQVIAEYERAL